MQCQYNTPVSLLAYQLTLLTLPRVPRNTFAFTRENKCNYHVDRSERMLRNIVQ